MSISVLMCEPKYFDIEYEINPWMSKGNQVDTHLAQVQWHRLYQIYTQQLGWRVKLLEPQPHIPDLVFTANGGLVIDGKAALPTFRHPVRQPETVADEAWFKANDYTEILKPSNDFEGEGDALVWNDTIFGGYPWRSDQRSHQEIGEFFGKKVISLQLADARFYHLDTCLTIVDSETVALWPKAFTAEALKLVHDTVPNVIEASDKDALVYGLNAMSDSKNIVIPEGANGLIKIYKDRGMNVFPTPISEFQKSGGGVKCLTLELRD
ncbi:MAG TPA: arginine deiminase-related protein [Candidatus Saccharimonadales bacterium]|nr:arginine deiminase-related protein [Candidatus Saccharimonadales bacterium]